MKRRIQLTLLESNISAIAELYDEDAPRTCAAMWQLLATPYEAKTLHAIFEGRKITLEPPVNNRTISPEEIPAENTTAYPVTGDLLWKFFPPRSVRGLPDGLWDVMLVYGPEVILKNTLGIYACNLWGHIAENLEVFVAECADVRIHGAKTIRLSRIEE
jgi:hypothetical protein